VNKRSNTGETAEPVRAAFVDHLTLRVRDLEASRRFYRAALSPWGSREVELESGEIAFGPEGSEDLVIVAGEPSGPIHLAFAAPDRETVDRFHQAALAAGGRDNGAPGERSHYHPGYYAAYVIDPDRNNVEAVFHGRAV
jgi:catechol 2,3-dioxygenase-like lactoylglutathione lyase family enzyme